MEQWYRKNAVKACVLLTGVLSGAVFVTSFGAASSIAGTADPSAVADMIREPYEESSEFNATVEAVVDEVFQKIKLTDFFETDGAYHPDKVIDIMEYGEYGTADGENQSGVAYRLEDLVNWSDTYQQSGVELHEENGVVVCQKPDGNYDYYYTDDFLNMFESGLFMAVFGDEYMTQTEFLRLLEQGTYASSTVGGVTIQSPEAEVRYVDCWNFGQSLKEKYAPIGFANLLEAVNVSPELNGRLSDIYNALEAALSSIYVDYESYQANWEYLKEGNMNLTYLYVDTDARKVYTNRAEYGVFADAEKNIEKMMNADSAKYLVIYPDLEEVQTNMNLSVYDEWLNVRAYERDEDSSNIFAVAVDASYPIQDVFYQEHLLYSERVPTLSSALVLFLVSGILFLVCTVWAALIAGRKPDNNEVFLTAFDKWKTEIAAAAVILLWFLPAWVFLTGGYLPTSWQHTADAMEYYIERFGGSPAFYATLLTGGFGMADTVQLFIFGLYTFACFFAGYTSLVRRIKAGTLWKGSLLCAVISFGKRVIRARSVTTKTVLGLGAFLLLHWLLVLVRELPMLLVVLIADGTAVWCVLSSVMAKARIRKGIEEIASGNLEYRIDLHGLRSDDLDLAEKVNSIGNGLNRAVDEAMKNERLKTDLITNVSHDIKTPLTSIINYVDILKRSDIADEKIRGYLDILEAKAQRLKTLTEDVVEASKVSSGNITLECMDMNLTELIQQTEGEMAEKFAARNLTLVMSVPEEPAVIHADGRRMWRVLENIFGNAAKYAMPGTRVYADLTLTKEQVNFSLKNVSEQQLNISADELTERFIRGDISRSTEGSGLGLSIAKSLTILQGGEFQLYLDGDLFRVDIRFKRMKS